MFILETFLEQFVFIWGHEQCSNISNQISLGSYYYLNDLKIVYYNCHGLPYGKEDQTLLIDDEPSKVLRNPKWNDFKKNHSGDKCCQITRCNDWTSYHICAHHCLNCYWQRRFVFIMIVWPNILSLVRFPLQRIIIGSSSILIMILAMFTITTPL
jgi:hypothetical protein